MHLLPVSESILQGKARGGIDNDIVECIISPVYIRSMGSLEVGLNWREDLEQPHIEVVLISIRIWQQKPVVKRMRVKRETRGRTAGLELSSFVDTHISSMGNQSAPLMPMVFHTHFSGRT